MQGLLIAILMMGDTTSRAYAFPLDYDTTKSGSYEYEGDRSVFVIDTVTDFRTYTPLTLELAEEYLEWCNGVAQRDTVREGDCYGYFRIHHKPPILHGWYSIVGETPTFTGFISYLKGRR